MTITRACSACRLAKQKCDHAHPACTYCVRRGLTCVGFPEDPGFTFRNEYEVAKRNSQRARGPIKQPLRYKHTSYKQGLWTESPKNRRLGVTEIQSSTLVYTDNKMTITLGEHSHEISIPAQLYQNQTIAIVGFFQSFLPRNSFDGTSLDSEYFKEHLLLSDALYYTSYAIGSLLCIDPQNPAASTLKTEALEAYSLGCKSMSASLRSTSEQDWTQIMETTILMGLFELACSYRGLGWRRHFEFGSRESFKKLASETWCSKEGEKLFFKFRIMEIVNSIVFARRSFLAKQPWRDMIETMSRNRSPNQKEDMLDLGLTCSDLCLSAAEFAFSLDGPVTNENNLVLISMAKEGIHMRFLLEKWKINARSNTQATNTEESIIAWTMFHTMSIYLHTSFAVNDLWTKQQIAIPVLSSTTLRNHVNALIKLVERAISSSTICPVVFLSAIYVAGTSTTSLSQRTSITNLLIQMRKRYNIAQTCLKQIANFWAMDEILKNPECPYPVLKHHRYLLLGHLKNEIPSA